MALLDRRTLTLAACAVCAGLALGIFLVFPIWAPAWMSDFKVSRGSVMLAYSGSWMLMILMMPVVGRLLTRTPAWRLVAIGAVVMGGGLLLASTLKTFVAFTAVYVLAMGVGASFAGLLPNQTAAIRLFPRHVGAIGGLLMVALSVLGVTLPIALTPLKAAIGWRPAFAALGGGVAVLVPLLAFCLMREPAGVAAPREAEAGAADRSDAAASTGEILKRGAFWLILGAGLPAIAVATAVQANLLPILADRGVGQGQASLVLSGLAAGTAIGAAVLGWLADRFDPRPVLLGAAVFTAAALAALAGGHGLIISATAAAAMGAASGGVAPLMSALIFREFRAGFAPALGLLNVFLLPTGVAPALFGYVRDATGSYSMVLLLSAPLAIAGALGVFRLRSPAAGELLPAPASAI